MNKTGILPREITQKESSVILVSVVPLGCSTCMLVVPCIQKDFSGNAYVETELSFGLKDQEMIFKVGTTWHEVRGLNCFNYINT